MNDCRALFVEEAIISSVKRLLTGRVNEILGELEFPTPLIEFSGYVGGSSVVPVISLTACELTEKERIVRLNAYSLTISLALPESPDSELYCYAYAAAVDRAAAEDPALGGVASRAVLMGKKYTPPKKPHCGDGWEVVLSVQVTVESDAYAG
ncbi:hypothetical protein AGMMS49991_08240 [Spirochaetia bacterium]|nr:hypothetical protein AGMMS49991_08240 [Spirochaetia bacterium]